MPGSTDNLIARLRQMLARDSRKAAFLGGLILVMLILWGRLLLTGDNAPTPASAAPVSKTDNQATKSNTSGKQPRISYSKHAERLAEWTNQPVQPLRRNLFVVNLSYYRRDGSNGGSSDQNLGFWGELEKSREVKTDQKKARRILIENLQLQASRIKLQSTMMGAKPQAMVNGTLVGVGDVVAVDTAQGRTTFRVLEIEARGMIVEHEGIKLAVTMN